MNNDISRDITSYSKVQVPTGRIELTKTTETVPMEEIEVDFNAMDCLGIIGYAQVNMRRNDSVRKSVEQFTNDPFKAEAKMEFCDSLIKDRGYDVWQAIKISDAFFGSLEKQDTYRE